MIIQNPTPYINEWHKFSSVQEILDLPAGSKRNLQRMEQKARDADRDPDFYGGTAKECLEIQTNGWKAGINSVARIERQIAEKLKLKANAPEIKRRVRKSRQGDELDIHAVRAGNLDRAWRAMERQPKERKAYNIYFACGYTSEIQVHQALYIGGTALALMNLLQKRGAAVSLTAINMKNHRARSRFNYLMTVSVKAMKQRLSMDRLASVIHPSFHRWTGFHWVESLPKPVEAHGRSITIRNNDDRIVQALKKEDPNVQPIILGQSYSMNAAIRNVKELGAMT